METPGKYVYYIQNKQYIYQNDVIDVVLVSLLLILNIISHCSGVSNVDFQKINVGGALLQMFSHYNSNHNFKTIGFTLHFSQSYLNISARSTKN